MVVEGRKPRVNHIVFKIDDNGAGYYSGQCAEYCGTSHGLMRTAVLALSKDDFTKWAATMVPAPAPTTEPAPAETPAPTTAPATANQRAPINPTSPTGAPAPGRGTYQDLGPIPPGSAQQSMMLPGQPTLEEQGKQIFSSHMCVACHTLNGTAAQGKIGPNLTRFGMRRGVGAFAATSTVENVEKWIHRPQDIKPGALMPGAEEGAGGMPATGLNAQQIKAVAAYLKSLR
jgi:cytochrome c oxidase subunit 2